LVVAPLSYLLLLPPMKSEPPVQLTNFNDSVVAPSLSHDGRMLTFVRGPDFGRTAPKGCVSRMDESLSRSKNGAVNVGNTDLILPVRVRTCAENVGKTPEAFRLRGSAASAFQRWSVAKRPASVTPKGGALA